jgi:MFS family permease
MLVTMHQSIEASIPMTEAQFGSISSLFLLVYALMSLLGGYLADRVGRSRLIVVIVAVWSTTTWLSCYARTYHELLLMRALMGVSEGCYLPAASALITDYHRGPTRGLAVGLHLVGTVVGGAIGGWGGWLADHFTWHYAFAIVGIPSLLYCVPLLLLLRDPPREPVPVLPGSPGGPGGGLGRVIRPMLRAFLALLSNGRFLIAMLYWGLLGGVAYVVISWMPVYLQEHFGMTQGRAGVTTNASICIPQVLGLVAGGAWADRWSRTRVRARLYVPVIGLCAAIPGFFLAGHSALYLVTIATLALWGIGAGFSAANMMPTLCLICDPRYRATAFGVLNTASAVFGAVVIVWAGALRDRHIDLARYLPWVGASIALGVGLCLFMQPRAAPPAPLPS